MRLHGRLGQVRAGGEFGVAQPPGEQAEHLKFARGERGEIALSADSALIPVIGKKNHFTGTAAGVARSGPYARLHR